MNEEKDYEIPDEDKNPELEVDGTIKDDIIQKAIEKLPPKFKEVILLRDVQGFSYEEISQILNC